MSRKGKEDAFEGGFTLIEMLVAIMVVGILTAVALVGVAGLTNKSATTACVTSMNAAKDATSAYYAATQGTYPQTFSQLTSSPAGQPLLDSSDVVVASATTLKGKSGWTLTMQPGPTTADQTTFTGCS